VAKKASHEQKPMVRQCTAYSGNLTVKLTLNDGYQGKPNEFPKATCSSATLSTRRMERGLYGKTPESTRVIYVTIWTDKLSSQRWNMKHIWGRWEI